MKIKAWGVINKRGELHLFNIFPTRQQARDMCPTLFSARVARVEIKVIERKR